MHASFLLRCLHADRTDKNRTAAFLGRMMCWFLRIDLGFRCDYIQVALRWQTGRSGFGLGSEVQEIEAAPGPVWLPRRRSAVVAGAPPRSLCCPPRGIYLAGRRGRATGWADRAFCRRSGRWWPSHLIVAGQIAMHLLDIIHLRAGGQQRHGAIAGIWPFALHVDQQAGSFGCIEANTASVLVSRWQPAMA